MIKVNLLQNQSESADGATEFDIQDDFGGGGGGSQKDSIIKIVLMLIPTGLLMIWESSNISSLNEQLQKANVEKNAIHQEVEKNKKLAIKAKGKQKEVLELEAKINIIRGLSKIRLRELKAFDTLQNIIPEKVWLQNLDYKDTALRIEGAALSDESLNNFVESLESKSYFKNVILLKAVEEKTKLGAVKVFIVNSELAEVE